MNFGPAITSECLAPVNGGGLQVRTGGAAMLALPLWCKSLTNNNTSRENETSELNNSRRYFFDSSNMPGYLTGYFYASSHQLHQLRQLSQPEQPKHKPTSHKPAGFFNDTNDDTNIDPAFAGSICLLTNNNRDIPTMSRDFSCTKETI